MAPLVPGILDRRGVRSYQGSGSTGFQPVCTGEYSSRLQKLAGKMPALPAGEAWLRPYAEVGGTAAAGARAYRSDTRYNACMEPVSAEQLRDSAVGWALWKVLDAVLARARAYWADSEATAATAPPGAVEPAALQAAARQLADTGSPVVAALSRIWAAGDSLDQAALSAILGALKPAEALVAAAVLQFAVEQQPH